MLQKYQTIKYYFVVLIFKNVLKKQQRNVKRWGLLDCSTYIILNIKRKKVIEEQAKKKLIKALNPWVRKETDKEELGKELNNTKFKFRYRRCKRVSVKLQLESKASLKSQYHLLKYRNCNNNLNQRITLFITLHLLLYFLQILQIYRRRMTNNKCLYSNEI